MNRELTHEADEPIERMLRDLGDQGTFDALNDTIIDRALAKPLALPLSTAFRERALMRMAEAQHAREAHHPTRALGLMISRAREMIGKDVVTVAQVADVSSSSFEAFEQGALSLRQIMTVFSPYALARLINWLGITYEPFVSLILKAANSGTRTTRLIAGRTSDRRQLPQARIAVEEVADYIAAIEQALRVERAATDMGSR